MRTRLGLGRTYRVDNVPWPLQPAFLAYGYGVGGLLFVGSALVHLCSAIEFEGTEHLSQDRNHIFGAWHQAIWLYLVACRSHRRHVWLIHPHWYMMPIHVLLRLIGVERLILGSTGNSGRKAADELLLHLRAGASTGLAPDGPDGPSRDPRKGILHLSAQSGVPIIPVRIRCSHSFKLWGWDQKVIPLPFGKITVQYCPPIRVSSADFAQALSALTAQL
jgi:lysophospholipid acyltransferase (LPLAT)-like uncharacterized protein